MAIFAGSVVLLLGLVYWSTAGFMARQTDESLLALASLRDPRSGEPIEYTFTCRPTASGQRLRWAVPAKDRGRPLYLTCVIPHLQHLQPHLV